MSSLETVIRAAAALAVVLVVGGAWLRGRLPAGFTLLERLVARLLLGASIACGAALLLADAGAFGGWSLLALLAALAGGGLFLSRRAGTAEIGELPRRAPRSDLLLVGLASLLIAFALPTFPWILGGRDPGTYVNAAVQMGKTHSTEASYGRLREVPREVLPHLSLWEPDPIKGQPPPPPPADPYERDAWPGMYLRAPDRILPQGYHLLPAALAAGAAATGDFGLWVVPAAAVLALLVTSLYAGRVVEWGPRGVAEGVTGLLLVVSVGFVWYARYPASEMLDLALSLGGLWLGVVAARTDNTYLGGVAGLVLGSALLTRPDAALTVPAVAALLVWLVASGRYRPVWGRFAAMFAAAALAATAHALLFARPYLDDVSRHFTGDGPKLAALAAAALLVAAGLIRHRRRAAALVDRHAGAIGRWLPVLALAVLAVFGAIAGKQRWIGFNWLRWYMSDAGLVAAAAGLAVVLRRAWSRDRLEGAGLLLLLAASTLLLYGHEPKISPDQFWGFRRFLPVMLPAFAILCAAAASAALANRTRWRPAALAVLIGATAFLVPKLALDLRPTLGHVEYSGVESALTRLDARLGARNTLVLFGPDDVALHRFGLAIAFQRDRDAYPVTSIQSPVLVRWLVEQAAARPVRLVSFGRPPALDASRLDLVRETSVAISLPEFDKPGGGLPDGAHRIAGRLTVWRLGPAVQGSFPAQDSSPTGRNGPPCPIFKQSAASSSRPLNCGPN